MDSMERTRTGRRQHNARTEHPARSRRKASSAQFVPLDLKILTARYEKELRWQLGNSEREDLTLKLRTEMIEEERSGAAGHVKP